MDMDLNTASAMAPTMVSQAMELSMVLATMLTLASQVTLKLTPMDTQVVIPPMHLVTMTSITTSDMVLDTDFHMMTTTCLCMDLLMDLVMMTMAMATDGVTTTTTLATTTMNLVTTDTVMSSTTATQMLMVMIMDLEDTWITDMISTLMYRHSITDN